MEVGMLRKMLLGMGFFLVIVSSGLLALKVFEDNATAEVVMTDVRSIPSTVGATPTQFLPMIAAEPTATIVVTPEPEPTKIFTENYIFGEVIDLDSSKPVALAINLPEGGWLLSNWAGAIGYKETDNQDTVFAPYRGIVYSYLGDVAATWAHSGISMTGQRYFASNIEMYLRKSAEGKTLKMSESQEKAQALIGSSAYICQQESGEVSFLTDFNGECVGEKVELELVAAAIVPHEKMAGYDGAVLNIRQWMEDNFSEGGFDRLTKENGWIIRFCVGKFSDQTPDDTPWYLYNRGVLGFRIKE